MPQYLVANYLPDNFDPSTVTEAMVEQIRKEQSLVLLAMCALTYFFRRVG